MEGTGIEESFDRLAFDLNCLDYSLIELPLVAILPPVRQNCV
jgi:hypothetical protein